MSARPLWTRGFVAVLATQGMFGLAFAFFLLLPKFLATELDAGAVEIGYVTALYGVAAVLLMPSAGGWVDRFGRLRFLRGGIVLFGISAVGFLFVDQVGPLVYALRFLQGVAWALAFAGAGAFVIDYSPPERHGQAIGLFGVSMLAMNAVAPALAEEIADRAGWFWVFLLAAGATVLSLALSFLIREVHDRPSGSGPVPGVLEVLRRPRSVWFLCIIATNGAAFGCMFTFSQPFALELGIEHVRGFFVAYTVTAVGVRLFLGRLADRAGRPRVSVLGGVLYGASVLAMAALEPGRLTLLGAAFGLAHGLFYPAFNALAIEDAGPHERGKIMSLFNGSFNGGWAIGGIGFGILAESAGYPAVFLLAGAITFAGVALLITSPEVRHALRNVGDGP